MLPSAVRSPQPKHHLDRFRHFCTAHGTVSSGMPGHVLCPKISPSHAGFRSHLIRALLNPPESITQTVSRSLQPFFRTAHGRASSGMSGRALLAPSHGVSGPPSQTWSPVSTRLSIPNGISIGEPSLHSSQQRVPVFYNGPPSPSHGGSGPMVPWAHPSSQPNRHLDRFSRFCRAHDCLSDVFCRSYIQVLTWFHSWIVMDCVTG